MPPKKTTKTVTPSGPILSRRALNRALLARQLLLQRAPISALEAVRRVAGLQAQVNNPPYIGLWTRLATFTQADLTRLREEKLVVRVAAMRSTLHLLTADDYLTWWGAILPGLIKAMNAFFGPELRGVDIPAVIAAAEPFMRERPRPIVAVKAHLGAAFSAVNSDALNYAVRTYLPLIQVPPGGTWGTAQSGVNAPHYQHAEPYLGRAPNPSDGLPAMIRAYLAAFGPASVMDFQAWAGLTKIKPIMEAMRPELVIYRDEDGVELFDLPNMPLPDPDTPAPIRFVPELDNLIIAHADRRRVISDEDKPKVFLSAARVMYTLLVDGFVAGTWNVLRANSRGKGTATLIVKPFQPLTADQVAEVMAEGDRLVRWIDPNAPQFAVQIE